MTRINIYENKHTEETSLILQENLTNELNDIKEMLKELRKDNLRLKQLIMELDLRLLKENEEKKDNKEAVSKTTSDTKIKTVTGKQIKHEKTTRKRHRLKDNEKFEIVSSAKELYNDLKLLQNGEFEHGTYRRKHKLKYDIYDVLYIDSVSSSENFTMGDFKKLVEKNDWDRHSLFKLIYNIRNNQEMFNRINNLRTKGFRKKWKFSKQNEILYADGVNTEIPVYLARDWCDVYMNSNKSIDVYVWELQKKYANHKEWIPVIIYNHGNNELVDVLKKDKSNPFVENNPSKRKNLIMNGGLI